MSFSDHFSVANIPFGIASGAHHSGPTVTTRLHDHVFFLRDLDLSGCSPEIQQAVKEPTLNGLAAVSKDELRKLRARLQDILADASAVSKHGVPLDQVQMHLPVNIRGFTDFSCSIQHVLNAGEAATGQREMPPAALHFPIGYSGRASSVVVSGTSITRPHGQFYEGEKIVFGPSRMLDFELEVGCIIGKPSKLGERVSVNDADEHIFGLVLLNDWSARDIQVLEMKPLGPINGKSFGTSISPWVITLEALEPFAAEPPAKEIPPVAYLSDPKTQSSYSVSLGAEIIHQGKPTQVCKAQLNWMYWTFRDMVAQQTINGCNINTGDLLATGTVSGLGDHEHGCLLESTKAGRVAFTLSSGQERTWLEDGDEVRLGGFAGPGVGFGDCLGSISAALPF